MSMKLARIERQTLSERVYCELRDLIITARALPGERMTLRTLAGAIGVSPMPVREAVNRLVAERALEVLPSRAVRVPIMTRARFADLRTIRVALEGLAAELAAERRDESDLAEIRRNYLAYQEEGKREQPDPTVAIQANREFHFGIYRAAHSTALLPMIEGLWLQVGAVLNLGLRARPTRLRTVAAHRHHTNLLKALEQRDPERAREALVADIMTAGDEILANGTVLK